MLYKIRGKDGKIPTIFLKNGKIIETDDIVNVTFSKDGPKLFIKPEVQKDINTEKIQIKGNKDISFQALEKVKKRNERSFSNKDFKNINIEIVEHGPDESFNQDNIINELKNKLEEIGIAATVNSVEYNKIKPRINHSITFGMNDLDRGIVKMALGFAIFILGEEFGIEPEAQLLRRFIWEDNEQLRENIKIKGQVFPNINENIKNLDYIFSKKGYHIFALIDAGDGIGCYINLFGEIPNLVYITDKTTKYKSKINGGKVLSFQIQTKEMSILSFHQFVASRLDEINGRV